MAWHVYLARCGDGSLYTGITTDPARREATHNAGRGAAYTRARRPVRLVHVEPAADLGAALRRELAIKRMARVEKEQLVKASEARAPKAKSSARYLPTLAVTSFLLFLLCLAARMIPERSAMTSSSAPPGVIDVSTRWNGAFPTQSAMTS